MAAQAPKPQRRRPWLRQLAVAVGIMALGASIGLSLRAVDGWRARQVAQDVAREAQRRDADLNLAGIALRAALSDLYREDPEPALADLDRCASYDPGNGYTQFLRAIALADGSQTQQAADSVKTAAGAQWTDYSGRMGLPSRVEMERERLVLERGGERLAEAFVELPDGEARAALEALRQAGLAMASLMPGSTVHLRSGADLRVVASARLVEVAHRRRDDAAVASRTEQLTADREWAASVQSRLREHVAGLADVGEFSEEGWIEWLNAEQAFVAEMVATAPE